MTRDDKLALLKTMCKSFSKEQVEHLEGVQNVDARYKCAQLYMREINEGQKGAAAGQKSADLTPDKESLLYDQYVAMAKSMGNGTSSSSVMTIRHTFSVSAPMRRLATSANSAVIVHIMATSRERNSPDIEGRGVRSMLGFFCHKRTEGDDY